MRSSSLSRARKVVGLIAGFWIGNPLLMVLSVPLVGKWVKLLQLPYRMSILRRDIMKISILPTRTRRLAWRMCNAIWAITGARRDHRSAIFVRAAFVLGAVGSVAGASQPALADPANCPGSSWSVIDGRRVLPKAPEFTGPRGIPDDSSKEAQDVDRLYGEIMRRALRENEDWNTGQDNS